MVSPAAGVKVTVTAEGGDELDGRFRSHLPGPTDKLTNVDLYKEFISTHRAGTTLRVEIGGLRPGRECQLRLFAYDDQVFRGHEKDPDGKAMVTATFKDETPGSFGQTKQVRYGTAAVGADGDASIDMRVRAAADGTIVVTERATSDSAKEPSPAVLNGFEIDALPPSRPTSR